MELLQPASGGTDAGGFKSNHCIMASNSGGGSDVELMTSGGIAADGSCCRLSGDGAEAGDGASNDIVGTTDIDKIGVGISAGVGAEVHSG